MSYGPVTTVQDLANVIQGEASNPNDQFGVASTIWNRLQNGGWGNSITSVVTPSQFNGYQQAAPGSNAYNLAQSIFNGTLPQQGNTGNVLYYSASNYSTNPGAANYVNPSMQGVAGAGNTLSPGGNSYATGSTAGPSVNGTILPSLGSGGGQQASGGGQQALTDSDLVDPNYDYSSAQTGASLGGDPLGSSVTMNPTFDPNNVNWGEYFDDGSGGGATAAAGAVSGPTSANTAALGGGAPINITDLPGADTAITGAGSAVQKGATTAGSDVQTAAGGIAGTAASISNSIEGYTSSALVMLALVILGLIFVAFGLGMFKHVQIPATV